eukprot:922203-Pyramimonas_sp.AAC.1
MRPPHPVQRFVAPNGAPRKAPVGVAACVRHTQRGASWPHRELHIRPQWGWPHASATPSAAFRGPIGGST